LREAAEGFAPLAAARGVTLCTELTDGVVAPVDADALRQMLLNLLDNAVKYGPSGQTVTLSLKVTDGRALVCVDDQGPGIPAADRERIWDRFWRLERDRGSAVAGTGIGLSVVRELVALHGGRVWAEDVPAGGAVGSRGQPVRDRAAARAAGPHRDRSRPVRSTRERARDTDPRGGGQRRFSRSVCATTSRSRATKVLVVEDGTQGLARARDAGADLIILDLMLPGLDGYRVLRALRDEGRRMPILILTARGEEADKVRGLRLGRTTTSTKPFGVLELLARVEALFAAHRSTGRRRWRAGGVRRVEVIPHPAPCCAAAGRSRSPEGSSTCCSRCCDAAGLWSAAWSSSPRSGAIAPRC